MPWRRSQAGWGVSTHSLYQWVKRYSVPQAEREASKDQQAEMRRLKAELKRVAEERDILKKAADFAKTTTEVFGCRNRRKTQGIVCGDK
ncbi:MAG: ISPsy26, transposase orfA [Herminiimonas sp.]|nr:ISPsy26, transposase orfA [Herminiimonas sp.]